ncbi:4-hydroxy-tetrahydrodipicolinate synthase [Rhodoplanes serenus]|jgi:4-hydroxy-tetrahydrodipicolinate synthase|uniref:4-hydroxy-tetrahydrodipicolinate synthase n=1 Tax=Rhodoplanes serenus TaxID=200615 RepID=A0A9X4XQ57_9BRAD|nr:4-hydroxy-tetrahydrodipicolinate synthase [Rhodoplanes serenus]MTW19302.1 4-hydroxy-tetrahydrodipicolinate synthase [Rhodoplanes serenus]
MTSFGDLRAQLAGASPALPTPFDQDGAVDYAAFERFCDLQIEAGAATLVVCGTTGESATLSAAEHRELIRRAVDVAAGRVPVIAGAGSNATARAIEMARAAEDLDADAILSVVPYYNKPTQGGLMAHFGAIADATALPVILYDVPSRTACSLADDTVVRLAERPTVIGLKDASGDIARPARLRPRLGRDFRLLSGDDATVFSFLLRGGDGCISVVANLAPGLYGEMIPALRLGQMARAQRHEIVVARIAAALFQETSPSPLKYALGLLGLMTPTVRLPLVGPSDPLRTELATLVTTLCNRYPQHLIGASRQPPEPARAAAGG